MKLRQRLAHMRAAYVYAGLSYCKRLKVGCVIVKNNRLISIGYNGTPPDTDNCCEDQYNNTKPDVRHAEFNALDKLKQCNEDLSTAELFVTTCPCLSCAMLIVSLGIRSVVFDGQYRSQAGIDYLVDNGVNVSRLTVKPSFSQIIIRIKEVTCNNSISALQSIYHVIVSSMNWVCSVLKNRT